MRPIKFRSWNGEDIISPDYITRDGLAHWKENSIPTSSDILMQFTGLKDKNGVEVYEGDIVKILYTDCAVKSDDDNRTLDEYLNDKAETKVVIWDTQGFYVSSKVDGYSESIEPGKHGFIQVIGNRFENPELLSN